MRFGVPPLRPPGPRTVLREFRMAVREISSGLKSVIGALADRKSLIKGSRGRLEVQMIGVSGHERISRGKLINRPGVRDGEVALLA